MYTSVQENLHQCYQSGLHICPDSLTLHKSFTYLLTYLNPSLSTFASQHSGCSSRSVTLHPYSDCECSDCSWWHSGNLACRTKLLHAHNKQTAVIILSRTYNNVHVFYSILLPSVLWHCWLEGRKGIRPVKNGGWWRCALVSPDGVAPSWRVGVSASANFPLHHKVQKFSSGTGSPGWSQKKGCKMAVCVCVCNNRVVTSKPVVLVSDRRHKRNKGVWLWIRDEVRMGSELWVSFRTLGHRKDIQLAKTCATYPQRFSSRTSEGRKPRTGNG